MPKRTKSRALGLGIIGTGLMGTIHAQCYAKEKACRLIGYYNPTPSKAEALAAQLGGEVFADVDELLADDRIDAVSITSPQAVHEQQVIAAAKAGKHILCEKPLALTPKELDRIEETVKNSGITLMVAHQLRFHPVINQVRRHMGRLGAVYHLDLEMALRIGVPSGRCWESYRLGGFFMELGCHLTDLARYLLGPVQHVTGYTLRLNAKRVTEDHTHCLVRFDSGAIGSIIVSANHRTRRQGLMTGRVLGEKGRIDFTVYPYGRAFNKATLTLDHGKSLFVPDTTVKQLDIGNPPSPVKVYAGFFDVYQQEIRAFIRAVRTESPPPCTLADGRAAVELVLATYHQQGIATVRRNFIDRPKRYRSNAASHPRLSRS